MILARRLERRWRRRQLVLQFCDQPL